MNDCIFCKIINNEIDSKKIYEDEKVIVILDAFPKSEGHSLIIPKKHSKNILDEEDLDILKYIKKTNEMLKKKYDFDSFKIISNKGKEAGQEVFHTHIHFVPYYKKKEDI